MTKTYRALYQIAGEIRTCIGNGSWSVNASAYARPYMTAMLQLDTIDDHYGQDSAKEIVLRFLCNAGTWRGETARRVKAELKEWVK